MKEHQTASTRVPFAGFYETKWSDLIDRHAEYFVENERESDRSELAQPEHLRLSDDELGEILFDVTDYSAGYLAIAKGYVDAFPEQFEDLTGFKLTLEWEEMTSPKFYNFETDRLFARAPLAHFYLLLRASRRDNHESFAATVKQMFTSRSGFISFYSNELRDWLDKPLREWDHNELYALLQATLEREAGSDAESDLDWAIYENWPDSGYSEWPDCVDWSKYDEKVAELRAEKAEEWAEEHPGETPPPYRCPDTIDMFAEWRPR